MTPVEFQRHKKRAIIILVLALPFFIATLLVSRVFSPSV